MQITQEAANLIDTLAGAASKIGSTAASAKINQVIVELLPPSQITELEEMVTQLQGSIAALTDANAQLAIDANAYRISNDIRGENLEVLRGKLSEINVIASGLLESIPADDDGEKLAQIRDLSAPIEAI